MTIRSRNNGSSPISKSSTPYTQATPHIPSWATSPTSQAAPQATPQTAPQAAPQTKFTYEEQLSSAIQQAGKDIYFAKHKFPGAPGIKNLATIAQDLAKVLAENPNISIDLAQLLLDTRVHVGNTNLEVNSSGLIFTGKQYEFCLFYSTWSKLSVASGAVIAAIEARQLLNEVYSKAHQVSWLIEVEEDKKLISQANSKPHFFFMPKPPKVKSTKLSLAEIGESHLSWLKKNFINITPLTQSVSLSEEAVEVARAVLKEHHGIRANDRGNLEEELADVILVATGFAALMGIDLDQAVVNKATKRDKLDFRNTT